MAEPNSERAYEASWRYARENKLNSRVRVLLLALARVCGRASSVEEIAHDTGVSLDRTRRALRRLRAQGAVRSTQVVSNGRVVYGWEIQLEGLGADQSGSQA
jgi:DNA-binding IclR family transcriptional regulator